MMQNFVQNVGNKIVDVTDNVPENATVVEINQTEEQENIQEENKSEE